MPLWIFLDYCQIKIIIVKNSKYFTKLLFTSYIIIVVFYSQQLRIRQFNNHNLKKYFFENFGLFYWNHQSGYYKHIVLHIYGLKLLY